jgi:predicted ATPase
MRLKEVYISDYKNLKEFRLSFESESFLDVFVGKNGTGKSNLFEALIEIFRHLFEFDKGSSADIHFDYSIGYEIEGKETQIEWQAGALKIDGKSRKKMGQTPLPDNVLVYYSGHNETVSQLIQDYEERFQGRIKSADASESRYFLGVGPEYKELLLSTLLIQPSDNPARRFVRQKLSIAETGDELRLVLKRPHYAKTPEYDVVNNDEKDRFWSPKGITKDFLDRLSKCISPADDNSPIRTEGYQANDDQYILYFDISKIQSEFAALTPQELFRQFDNLKVLGMLGSMSLPLTLESGDPAQSSFFSDGQFQSVYIYSIIELFKDRNCLTLLDEPDSFLHPEWQHQFLSQVFEISAIDSESNHVLLSSHSASTISASPEQLISLFEINGSSVKVTKASKTKVIDSLSAGLITFSEREARLNIQHMLKNTDGAVLFTEGITDEVILETAWSKLHPDRDCPFEIQNAFDCNFLGNLLTRDEIYRNHPTRTFFALFDFDEAFNKWNGFKGDTIEEDPCKCLTKKHRRENSYALMLPIPEDSTISNQVINSSTGKTYKDKSLFPIEMLFHGVDGLESYFVVDTDRPDNFIKFTGKKVEFANEIIPALSPECFQRFTPIFDFIESVID